MHKAIKISVAIYVRNHNQLYFTTTQKEESKS